MALTNSVTAMVTEEVECDWCSSTCAAWDKWMPSTGGDEDDGETLAEEAREEAIAVKIKEEQERRKQELAEKEQREADEKQRVATAAVPPVPAAPAKEGREVPTAAEAEAAPKAAVEEFLSTEEGPKKEKKRKKRKPTETSTEDATLPVLDAVLIIWSLLSDCFPRMVLAPRRPGMYLMVLVTLVVAAPVTSATLVVTEGGECDWGSSTCAAWEDTTAAAAVDAARPPAPAEEERGGGGTIAEKKKINKRAKAIGTLRPDDLQPFPQFTAWENTTVAGRAVAHGRILQQSEARETRFAVLPQVVQLDEVDAILALMNDPNLVLDSDPDTVDGMSTREMFAWDATDVAATSGTFATETGTFAKIDKARAPIRRALQNIMEPILEDRITPFIRANYPDECGDNGVRACTPCYSLVRSYKVGERNSHATHYDDHARVTVVVSLKEFGRDFRGGLYIATGRSQRKFVGLGQGDAVVHKSDLLHGVHIEDDGGERWSWIVWYRDSVSCADYGHEWFADCSNQGSATCNYLHASKGIPGQSNVQKMAHRVDLNQKAASQGHGAAMIKLARAHLGRLPSLEPVNIPKAAEMFRASIASAAEPDGFYGLAQMMLERQTDPIRGVDAESAVHAHTRTTGSDVRPEDRRLAKAYARGDAEAVRLITVVALLEAAAAGRHPFAMYNLGIVHFLGYGVKKIDHRLSTSWLGIPFFDPSILSFLFFLSYHDIIYFLPLYSFLPSPPVYKLARLFLFSILRSFL
jgi:hypothetical protein